METRMSDEKQPSAPLEATAMPEEVEACAKVLYDISDHARDFEALARRVLSDKKAAVDDANRKADAHYEAKMEGLRQFAASGVRAAVEKAENDWACACRMDCERERAERDTYWGERFDLERAERIAKVEEAAYDAHEYLPDDMYSAHRAISAIVAAAKGEKP